MLRLALVALAVFLVSCDQSSHRVSTLWTNVPEMASAAEAFNASQRDWQLLVEYRDDPAALLTSPGVKADLVIARGLASGAVKSAMVPLDFLFAGGGLAKASFYHRVLDAGQQDDRQKLLPLSIDFPVLIFAREQEADLPGFSVGIDDLKTRNQAFDALPAGKVKRKLAFSPRWDAFSPTFLQWAGAGFRENFQGALAWDNGLNAAVSTFQTWPSPGWDQVSDFQRKYLLADASPILSSGRIEFYPTTLASFLSRPWDERRDFDFRFLDSGGRALAAETTVWAGIPSSSLTRGAGERFLAWFFQGGTQKALVASAREQDDRSFGLAQGLSSLIETNVGPLSIAYPELAGRLPTADQIVFWPTLPTDWNTLKQAVVRPWIENQRATEAQLKTALEKQRALAERR